MTTTSHSRTDLITKKLKIMTPKEKADNLVTKMLKEVGYDTDLAIPCALIAVNEILNLASFYNDTQGEVTYWQEVKQEIEQEITNL